MGHSRIALRQRDGPPLYSRHHADAAPRRATPGRARPLHRRRVCPSPGVLLKRAALAARRPALAATLGLADVWIQDETSRFGLPAFKSVGVEFAVARLRERGGLDGVTTLVCASAGNHGRAVARAARAAGRSARIYLDRDVATPRLEAIASEGADIVRVDGTYDDAVRLAADDAARTGALVISDTSWDGYTEIPRDIMLGYSQVMDDAAAAWGDDGPPDVLLVQAGVGGLLAAVASWSAFTWGDERPRLIGVEPRLAACVQASSRAGAPTAVDGPLTTIMAGLRCGEVSPIAFSIVDGLVDAYVAVDDDWCRAAMRRLARPDGDDSALAVGTSGSAGIAALLALHAEATPADRQALGLTAGARAFVIATEGVTEPALWRDVTGG
ncbi:MAG: diaminopropionate ammonia-lyase [Vicinamibacterales bacterium]